MDRKAFKKKVEKELRGLSKEQVRKFAWLCAVRALPFLGGKGHFNFWKNDKRQRYMLAVLYALDLAYAAAVGDAAYAAYAANAAYAYADAAAADDEAYAYAAGDAAYAAYAAYGAYAADAAYAAYAVGAQFQQTLLNDLQTIKISGGLFKPQIEAYGEVWHHFHQALEAEDCGYWSRLYQDIFESEFVLDTERLESRLNVPKEIREQGAAAVGHYLEALEQQGGTHLNEARVIILGEKGAGKTCLARRLVDPAAPMTEAHESTPGVDTTFWKLENADMNVRIWDFAGHTVTHAVHQFFLSERCLYIMVYDGRTEDRNRLEYWLNHMANYGGNSQAFILVNKRDGHTPDIAINSLKEKYPIAGFYAFSIQDDNDGLEEFRNEVAAYISSNPSWNKLEIPTQYYQVKNELEEIFLNSADKKGQEHISKEDFNKIAKKHEVDNQDHLLSNLHALGVSLWYPDMEGVDTLVLNPEWISHGVYTIINWAHEQKKYSVSLKDFSEAFEKVAERYHAAQHGFLFKLMQRYELAFEVKDKQTLIIPHLLKTDQPPNLPVFEVGDSLMLRYKAEQPLPPNTISRFIVRHNEQIRKGAQFHWAWRYGVVLEDGKGTVALVREDDRTISVSVKGPDKTKYISTLRETLNAIFDSYKSNKPELQYSIQEIGEGAQSLGTPDLWLPEKEVLALAALGKPYYDYNRGRDIYLNVTVNHYNINSHYAIVGDENHLTSGSHNMTFNFHNCNISLQGHLNELGMLLSEEGKEQEAKALVSAASALEQAEACKSPEELQRKGIANRLKRLVEDLGDDKSSLGKAVKGIEHGVGIAQDIAKGYNNIAQWMGLPQVPAPFLKKEK
jgi:GTPase SAR1 family protein